MSNLINEELSSYKVVDYFDVWGNEEEGFEVNNLATIGTIEISDYTNYHDILRKLVEINFLTSDIPVGDILDQLSIYNEYEIIEFSELNSDKPLFRLELIHQ